MPPDSDPPPRLAIRDILHPRSVAVFGASDNRDKFGGRIMYFLTKHGFAGRLVPINPNRKEVFGRPAFPTIAAAGLVDVAILAVPQAALAGAIAECAAAGIGCCVIMTTGFAEASEEGARQQREIVATARRAGMRIVGPNCMGFLNPAWRLALCSSVVLDSEQLLTGRIGFVSQSGALMVSVFDRAYGDGIGFSACVSLGNQSDLEICDFLEYLIDDPATDAICLYVEGFADPPRFFAASAACRAAGKPLIVVKTGRTAAGVKAARSHTASLAGAYESFAAACRARGVVLAEDPVTMIRLADLLVRWPRLSSDGVGVISGSGGSVGLAVDRIAADGLRLASLAPRTRAVLGEMLLPPQADNPVDLGGRKAAESVEIAGTAMAALAGDPDVGVVLLAISSMPFFTPRTRLLAEAALASGKPVICSILPGPAADGPRQALREIGCPYFDSAEEAFQVLSLLIAHQRLRAQPASLAERPPGLPAADAPKPADLKALLAHYGIRLAREISVNDVEGAVDAARTLGYPVVMKGVAEGLLHKSDIGAVRVGLGDAVAVRAAWRDIVAALDRHVPGAGAQCLVQEMVEGGVELIIGAKRDPQFGPFVLAGFGGIYVELLRDVRLAPAPLSRAGARAVLRELRLGPVFDGVRGRPALDLEAAADVMERMSWLAVDLGEGLVDMEINPLRVLPAGEGAVAVDIRGSLSGIGGGARPELRAG